MIIDYIIPVVTAGIGAGAWELYKNITNRKSVSKQMRAEAKKAQAEADQAAADAIDDKHDAIEDNLHRAIERMEAELISRKEEKDMLETHLKQKSEMINDMQLKHDEQMLAITADKDARIRELTEEIEKKNNLINKLSSKVSALTILRCNTTSCPNRLPPFMSNVKLDVDDDGVVGTEEEM